MTPEEEAAALRRRIEFVEAQIAQEKERFRAAEAALRGTVPQAAPPSAGSASMGVIVAMVLAGILAACLISSVAMVFLTG